MLIKQNRQQTVITNGGLSVRLLDNGRIAAIEDGSLLISCGDADYISENLRGVFLRVKGTNEVFPLCGEGSCLFASSSACRWRGSFCGVAYEATLKLSGSAWVYDIRVEGDMTIDLLYIQDIAAADAGAVYASELYVSQYIDHAAISTEYGYAVSSRQNQPQGGRNPAVAQGALDISCVGYSTDLSQLLSLSYKLDGNSSTLAADLQNRNRQYELSCVALATEEFCPKDGRRIGFYGIVSPHSPAERAIDIEEASALYEMNVGELKPLESRSMALCSRPLPPLPLNEQELSAFYPTRRFPEYNNGQLHGFFTPADEYVELCGKSAVCERPSGNIVYTLLDAPALSPNTLCSTNYVFGVFNAQTVVGNTSMNKLFSVNRGLLNTNRTCGQRIYAYVDGVYRLLGVPSAYEQGYNYSKWIYKLPDDLVTVTVFAASDSPSLTLRLSADRARRYLISGRLVMGEREYEHDCELTVEDGGAVVRPAEGTYQRTVYPELSYSLSFPRARVISDGCLFADGVSRDPSLLLIEYDSCTELSFTVAGALEGEPSYSSKPFEAERARCREFYDSLMRGFKIESSDKDAEKLNVISRWYAHDAMIHYCVPHGLEQSSGAAWGTRDVCQGPVELFLSVCRFDAVRSILLRLFSMQTSEGEWPQWFMFDRYGFTAGDCHGDIIFWPLKALADYIARSGDDCILLERAGELLIIDRVKAAIAAIKRRFIGDTHLISYAGGDWDDTLQPAKNSMRTQLVSSWTQALAFETVSALAAIASDEAFSKELLTLADSIKTAFERFLAPDGIIAGFAYLTDDGAVRYMLHPRDDLSGISYRLIPITRSIISGLSSPQLSFDGLRLIDEKLSFPDGVRIMNAPAHYSGGECRLFVRAELSANVGREISLQYCHAHIRYLQALSRVGHAERLWDGIFKVLPVDIRSRVPNAAPRQSNVYFSSSDGDFDDRYVYEREFSRLKSGDIVVRAGWRLYSSGPGIFLSTVISSVFGITLFWDSLLIDPVLPRSMDGARVRLSLLDKPTSFIYHLGDRGFGIRRVVLNGRELETKKEAAPYRDGGARVPLGELSAADEYIFDIFTN